MRQLMVTKEKVLALVALLAAAAVISDLRPPRIEAVPPVPGEEPARAYRTVASAPRVHPEHTWKAGARDPFAVEDAWKEAAPALLDVPPADGWPRALPVGPATSAASPHDRLLAPSLPKQATAEPGDGQ